MDETVRIRKNQRRWFGGLRIGLLHGVVEPGTYNAGATPGSRQASLGTDRSSSTGHQSSRPDVPAIGIRD